MRKDVAHPYLALAEAVVWGVMAWMSLPENKRQQIAAQAWYQGHKFLGRISFVAGNAALQCEMKYQDTVRSW